ncbi:MAG: rhomboid family intramembrane serine protease [Calditrichota bacterium]|jgi:membrane associated rhomboid family serine protease
MYYQSNFSFMTTGVKNLLFANVAIFLLQYLEPTINGYLIYFFGLHPYLAFQKFYIWQFASYMFLHGGFWHIFFNMFALWMFGVELERTWGTKEFLKFYFLTGIAAGISTAAFHWGSMIPTIGASGAIYGILAAYALFFPDRYVYLYLLFPIKMKYLALILGAIEFLSAYSQDGIAHVAHLGGMVVGFIYLRHKYRHWGVGQDFFKNFFKKKGPF